MVVNTKELIDVLIHAFIWRGHTRYHEKQVNLAKHMLQAADIAQHHGESQNVVVAALLHDIGHLLFSNHSDTDGVFTDTDPRHEVFGVKYLRDWFPCVVTDYIRYHVASKRYLCAIEPTYLWALTVPCQLSLTKQGGPMFASEARQFEQLQNFEAIVSVRRYDDQAIAPNRFSPGIHHYIDMLRNVVVND